MDKQQQIANQFKPQGRVKVVKGSIINPENSGLRFVLNVANLAGKLDSPLYPLFDKKWPKVKAEVRGWFVTKTGAYKLGAVNTIAVQSDVWVLSLLCQKEDLTTDSVGLEQSLKEVSKMAKYEKASVAVSTLLTNSIPDMTNLLTKCLVNEGVSVTFYDEA
jgi:hypothetical protein